MKVRLGFVPPGGGEQDYQLQFELPAIPQPGDYISVTRDEQIGAETFIVRKTLWALHYPATGSFTATQDEHGTVSEIYVECEFARGSFMSEAHRRACDGYASKGYTVPEHEATGY